MSHDKRKWLNASQRDPACHMTKGDGYKSDKGTQHVSQQKGIDVYQSRASACVRTEGDRCMPQ